MEILEKAKKLLEKIDLSSKENKIREIEADSTSPSFWSDPKTASEKMKELASLQKEVSDINELRNAIRTNNTKLLEKLIPELEDYLYFSGTYDKSSALVSLHAGQGGVEAMDWCQMLFRMYRRFCEQKGWIMEIIDQTPGEEAGLKSVTFLAEGEYAYGFLKFEAGVHRLVRQSPFNADKLRQTSFALVEVMPQIEESGGIDVKEEDLEWDFYRSGGHGGQNVNKVSTAVRLKHRPSGIVVSAQSERYQGQNRAYALKLLLGKLWLLEEEKRRKEEEKLKGGYKTPGWGNQIRSYVLHPYKMVKDLRTNFESSNPEAILSGNLDGFIQEELRVLS
ncbi:MAG: peptide chain release factor 2 [Candidatus Levybacteria bacterium]|nr:peptide chain release factor 2 [Candidatus Levybacteria bacterium]